MCYELQYGEIKFDHSIFKYTNEHILNLNTYGDYFYVFVVDIHYPKNYMIDILNFQFYVINLYLQIISLKN